MEFEKGSVVFNGWKVTSVLGEGAFGKVYEIDKEEYGISAKSAMKVISIPKNESDIQASLNEGMDEEGVRNYFNSFVEMIIQEIAVMSSLKGHPNIVQYEDHEVKSRENGIGGDILIKMELLSSLQNYQRDHAILSRDTVLRIAKDLCSALAFCQKKGMVHRDIKPENIFVSETGQFKLGDFGIARTVEKTSGGMSKKGTESYMAPEVYKGEPYGQTVDIYSLGLVLYRLMNNNRLPFFPPAPKPITYADRESALNRRVSGNTPLPMPCNADPAFAKIIIKACAHDPADRYHSAKDMLDALNALDGKAASDDHAVSVDDDSWCCPNCRHVNVIGAGFCTECGTRKDASGSEPVAAASVQQYSLNPMNTTPYTSANQQYSNSYSSNPQPYSTSMGGYNSSPSMNPQMSYNPSYAQPSFSGVPIYSPKSRMNVDPSRMYSVNGELLLFGREIKRLDWVRNLQPLLSILIIIAGVFLFFLQSPSDLMLLPFGVGSICLTPSVRKYSRGAIIASGIMIMLAGVLQGVSEATVASIVLTITLLLCGLLIILFSMPLGKAKQAKYLDQYRSNTGMYRG